MYNRFVFAMLGLIATAPLFARAQSFDSGSNGSFGAIDVPEFTPVSLDLPPDGIIHATTVRVRGNGILKFNRNALNTPVYLLATGDVLIEGTIDVSGAIGTSNPPVGGKGGPGGFDGGMPGFGAELPPGAGHGPGAGLGETAANVAGEAAYGQGFGPANPNDGHIYGSTSLIPIVGGSGGGGTIGHPGLGGGGGGGAILIASNTRIDVKSFGLISADGGFTGCSLNSGSGGAVRLVSPVVAGTGKIEVLGNCAGGTGRIRIDAIDRTALQLLFSPNPSTTAIGSLMFVFPDVVPRLDIIQAAGQNIPEGTSQPVTVLLPFGSTSSRTVKVQARDFTGIVPIDVVLTPESGDRVVHSTQIDMSQGNPAQVTVNVDLPINVVTRIEAWTR